MHCDSLLMTTSNSTLQPTSTDTFRKKLSVDTSRFFLFLYIQSTPRLSLKSSFTTGDEWPSPEGEKRQRFPENAHLAFVKSHISEVLELLADTGIVIV